MYIDDWDSFYVQAEELWRQQPLKTRYCIKYRHTEGKLVLKVTDDVVVRGGRAGRGSAAQRAQIEGAARTCRAAARAPPLRPTRPPRPPPPCPAQCLKYKTDQLVDVKRMEKLNSLMFLLMSRGPNASMGEQARRRLRSLPRSLRAARGWPILVSGMALQITASAACDAPEPKARVCAPEPSPTCPNPRTADDGVQEQQQQQSSQQQQQHQPQQQGVAAGGAGGGGSKARGKGAGGRRKG
jgi:signal recognition particle subunit SRP9